MTLLAAFSRWVLAGGYKWILGAIAIFALYLGVQQIRHWKAESEKVPALNSKITGMETQAGDILERFTLSEVKRHETEQLISAKEAEIAALISALRDKSRDTPANTNRICLPTDGDRSVRNDALGKLASP